MGKQQLTVARSKGDHEVRLRTSAEPLAAERADRGAVCPRCRCSRRRRACASMTLGSIRSASCSLAL